MNIYSLIPIKSKTKEIKSNVRMNFVWEGKKVKGVVTDTSKSFFDVVKINERIDEISKMKPMKLSFKMQLILLWMRIK